MVVYLFLGNLFTTGLHKTSHAATLVSYHDLSLKNLKSFGEQVDTERTWPLPCRHTEMGRQKDKQLQQSCTIAAATKLCQKVPRLCFLPTMMVPTPNTSL